jgi:hypothetical protein
LIRSCESGHWILDAAYDDDCKLSVKGGAEGVHTAKKIAMAITGCYRAAVHKNNKSYKSCMEEIGIQNSLELVGAVFCESSYTCRSAGELAA